MIKLARNIQKKRVKVVKAKCDIKLMLYFKKNTQHQSSQEESLLLETVTTYGIKYHVKYQRQKYEISM